MPQTLSPTQKAFEFADELNRLYREALHDSSTNSGGPYSINSVLLEYLGKGKYEKFCSHIVQKYPTFPETSERATFKIEFANNTVDDKDILFDCQVRFYWKLPEIINTVKELI